LCGDDRENDIFGQWKGFLVRSRMTLMLTEWHTLFRSLGFSDTETKVYLACLELGPAAAQEIAKAAKVSRVTTYGAIESLTERGLMSSFMKDKRKRFMVEPPERLISYAEGRIKHAEDAVKHAREAMDDLKLVQKGERPIVKIFEGKEALKTIQEDILATKPEMIDEIANLDEIEKIYDRGKDLRPYFDLFDKANIPCRGIALKKKKVEFPQRKLTLKRISLNPDEFNFKGDILLYGNKVAISAFRGKQFSLLIENKDISETFRALFNLIFKK
jgi:sugar-specific transcriptional regulator TrmB